MSTQLTDKERAIQLLSGLNTDELNEVEQEVQTRKLKINVILIDQTGNIEYINNTTQPNYKFTNATGKLVDNRRRYEDNLKIRIKAITENEILKIVPYIFALLARWGYVITNRDRRTEPNPVAGQPDLATNIFDLSKTPLE